MKRHEQRDSQLRTMCNPNEERFKIHKKNVEALGLDIIFASL